MEYPKISALVPEGENFDNSAVNEGVWLSVAHIGSIEKAMVENTSTITSHETVIAEKDQQLADVNGKLARANETITAKDAEINDLKSQVEALKKQPAGEFKETPKQEDKIGKMREKFESEATKQNKKNRAAAGLHTNF